MARNISFLLTTEQVRQRTKTVTRRNGWEFVKVGDVLNGCVKCQGIKKGEKIEKMCRIRVTDVRREPLWRMTEDKEYGRAEMILEGFPGREPLWFVAMFIASHPGTNRDTVITRIEFEYMD